MNPEEVSADAYVAFYQYCHMPGPDDGEPGDQGMEAAGLEAFIRKYFHVSVNHLRGADLYNPSTGLYTPLEIGGAG